MTIELDLGEKSGGKISAEELQGWQVFCVQGRVVLRLNASGKAINYALPLDHSKDIGEEIISNTQ